MIKTKDFLNRDSFQLEPGDTIVCKGIRATIKEIKYQDYFHNDGFTIEFIDTNGNYRSWKQHIDGGKVIPKEN